MQLNSNPRFIKSFMIGLMATGAGAFGALPATAMPEAAENSSSVEVLETVPEEVLVEPTAQETLPTPDESTVADTDDMEAAPVAGTEAMEAAPVADTDDMEAAPVAEEISTEEFTIAELTSNSDSFKVLSAALAAADLTEVLEAEGPYTVFAPTDDAFADLPEGSVEQLLLPENKDTLVQVLSYHVVPSALLSTDLETGGVATVEGSEITVEVGDTITVDNANVVVADVEASNGIIHIIDRVILPPAPEANADIDATAVTQ